ncbi:hypothetical protein RR48_00525 [Papilio machaon]|uniref:Uncharacterized protein n=1 Tax=Papilio machaon TaxID=76193 RepID=A0A0N1PJ83_PAPMA|nr:hypothetical protein RR48_00525 [Papilio machaon]
MRNQNAMVLSPRAKELLPFSTESEIKFQDVDCKRGNAKVLIVGRCTVGRVQNCGNTIIEAVLLKEGSTVPCLFSPASPASGHLQHEPALTLKTFSNKKLRSGTR